VGEAVTLPVFTRSRTKKIQEGCGMNNATYSSSMNFVLVVKSGEQGLSSTEVEKKNLSGIIKPLSLWYHDI
jgi:hypothetical protein